jgi:hypothetical protein
MDPAIIAFGFGIGLLIGMTGMGGAVLMTPLLILVFGINPVTAIGTDIFYAAVTKTVGGFQHLRMKTVHRGLAFWMALGAVPAAVLGVSVIEILQQRYGADALDAIIFGILGATLLVVGVSTLLRTLMLADVVRERYAMHLYRRHIIAAVLTGLITGFVIGLTSAGSGTLMAIVLIAVFRLTPQRVVGTSIFTAAVLLWAASIAHWIGGNIDFTLAANILIGSLPGVIVGGRLAIRSGEGLLRIGMALLLVASGITLITKGDAQVVMVSLAVTSLAFGSLFIYAMRREVRLPHGEGVRHRRKRIRWSRGGAGDGVGEDDSAQPGSEPPRPPPAEPEEAEREPAEPPPR